MYFVLFYFTLWYDDSVVMGVKINKKLIGVRIMQRRKTAGLTQDELAEKVGLSPNHISNIECGKNLPTTKFILQVCNILGETPDYYLLGKIGEDTDEITRLVRQLTPDSQRVLRRLLETFQEEVENN